MINYDQGTCQLLLNTNTGNKRCLNILIRKFATHEGVTAEVTTGGWPLELDGKDYFPGYQAISQADFDNLPDWLFLLRANAYKAYIEFTYNIITWINWSDVSKVDDIACPLPPPPVTISISNLNVIVEGSEKEFDVVISDGSTKTINYYIKVIKTHYERRVTVEITGGITDSVTASAAILNNYKSGTITINGTAHIHIKIGAYDLFDVPIPTGEDYGYIKLDDNDTLKVNVDLLIY